MWLLGLGRPGGALMLLFGAALLWGTWRDIEVNGGYWTIMPALGVALCLFGGGLLVFGNRENLPLKEPTTRHVPLDVLAALKRTERPFWFCTSCRQETPEPYCDGCASRQHTMQVVTKEDVSLAVAVLESQ